MSRDYPELMYNMLSCIEACYQSRFGGEVTSCFCFQPSQIRAPTLSPVGVFLPRKWQNGQTHQLSHQTTATCQTVQNKHPFSFPVTESFSSGSLWHYSPAVSSTCWCRSHWKSHQGLFVPRPPVCGGVIRPDRLYTVCRKEVKQLRVNHLVLRWQTGMLLSQSRWHLWRPHMRTNNTCVPVRDSMNIVRVGIGVFYIFIIPALYCVSFFHLKNRDPHLKDDFWVCQCESLVISNWTASLQRACHYPPCPTLT